MCNNKIADNVEMSSDRGKIRTVTTKEGDGLSKRIAARR